MSLHCGRSVRLSIRARQHCPSGYQAPMMGTSTMVKPAIFCLSFVLLGCNTVKAITGGTTTFIEKHPYTVAIDYDDTMVCTGALLSSKTVITAASCFALAHGEGDAPDARLMTVRVGSQLRDAGGEAYLVASFLQHPEASGQGGPSDLLLLHLKEQVTFHSEVHSVPLVGPSVTLRAGERVIITGYGGLSQEEVPQELQVAALPIFNTAMCAHLYTFVNGDNRACAGGLRSGMCGSRDVGAPVVDWLGRLVGLVVQMKAGCATQGEPTVFQSLVEPSINQWVMDNMDPATPVLAKAPY